MRDNRILHRFLCRWLVPGVVCAIAPFASAADPDHSETSKGPSFRVTFADGVLDGRYSGRIHVVVTPPSDHEPRLRMGSWFEPPYLFATDVRNITAETVVLVDGVARAYPLPLDRVPAGRYQVQVVARRSLDHPTPGRGDDDLYSDVIEVNWPDAGLSPIDLSLRHVVRASPFEETDRVKQVELVSKSLSTFHGRTVTMRAGVVLPGSWKEDAPTPYPVLYFIPGFGGSHRMVHRIARLFGENSPADEVIVVVPDTRCYRGHHAFADSANNGPWGAALMEELIPVVEKRFHGARSGARRFVTGVSSGGWSALWLQITYPDSFNGCWAHCPDPVDFRDFQRINLYEPGENMYVDRSGRKRPLARQGENVLIEYEDFVRREEVLGPGGQIHSFEAVFSPKGPDGNPLSLFDRATGRIDTTVARTWERYDIRLVLERNWERLTPRLRGKLHIYAGGQDTFYLDGAVMLLKESLERLGSDAEVKIIPDMGHTVCPDGLQSMWDRMLKAPDKSEPRP